MASDRPLLVCPECRTAHGGLARIGNRKDTCRTCNRFGQAVRRSLTRRLLQAYPEEAAEMRIEAEGEVYPKVVRS